MSPAAIVLARILAAASAAFAAGADAAPVVDGSGYSLYLSSGAPYTTGVPGITFDGQSESFTRTITFGGQTEVVAFTVDEEQFSLGGGAHLIRIVVDADGDLYPVGAFAGFAFGPFGDDPLDLAMPVRLVSNEVTIYAGDQALGSGDWTSAAQQFGQTEPWDGYFISATHFGALIDMVGLGVDRVEFTVQVQQIPEPGALALAAAGLALLGWRRRHGVSAGAPATTTVSPG